MKVLSAQQVQAEDWNTAVAGDPQASYLQTYQAAQFEAAAAAGTMPHFFFANGQRLLGLQTPWFAIWMPALRWPTLLQRIAAQMGCLLHFRGDLAEAAAGAAEGPDIFLSAVEEWARRKGVFRIVGSSAPRRGDRPPNPPPLPATYQAALRATIILRLEGKTSEQLWRGLAKNARNGVRRAERQGIEWLEAQTAEHIDAYYRIRCESYRRQGLMSAPRRYFHLLRQHYPADMYRFWLTRHNGEWVSGQNLGIFNGNITLCGVCHSDYARANGICGNDWMQWHVIRWAAVNGMRSIDWGGFFLAPATEHEWGINRYKEKWGGELNYYWDYSRVIRPAANRLFEAMRRLWGIVYARRTRAQG